MQPADPSALSPAQPEAARLRAILRLPWDLIAMAGAILYWGVLGLAVTILCAPLALVMPREKSERFGRMVHHCIFLVFTFYMRFTGLLKMDIRALDKLAKLDGPIIVAPNHASLWDAVFIIARLPQAICVMKKSILKNPFLGGGSRLSGYIPNGTTTRMIRDAAETLGRGGQLLLFPEGTRTHPSARWINPLKGGCALIAARAGVPIHPVFIRSNSRYLQKGWPVWKPPVFPIHVSIEVGEPLTALENESAADFTKRLQAVYEQELSRPHPLRRQIDP